MSNDFSTTKVATPILTSIHQLLIYPWRNSSGLYNFLNPLIIDIDDYFSLINIEVESSHPTTIVYDLTANNEDKLIVTLSTTNEVSVSRSAGATATKYAIFYR